MQKSDRKAATAAYKEQKTVAGIFAIRGPASGQCWVGQAPNLATIWNRMSFMLRQGSHPTRALQSAWSACGGEGFVFEELERLDDDLQPISRGRVLKERHAHWVAALDAAKL
jgi:hypothetical protein